MIACNNGLVNGVETCPEPGRVKIVMFGFNYIFCINHGKGVYKQYKTSEPICHYLTGRVPVWVTGRFA